MTKVLIFGATGGIGSHALVRLLDSGVAVTAIVRDESRLPAAAKGHAQLSVVVARDGHLNMELEPYVRGCSAIVSCVGHPLSRKGIWGEPKRLCVDTTRKVCEAVRALSPAAPMKYIVINTEGVDRVDGADPRRGLMERIVLGLLYYALPPHADNMATVAYLHNEVAGERNPHVEFCAVRPSDLTDKVPATEYSLNATLQNGIFAPGSTRRVNVGHFMADLATKPDVWAQWKERYPHILDA